MLTWNSSGRSSSSARPEPARAPSRRATSVRPAISANSVRRPLRAAAGLAKSMLTVCSAARLCTGWSKYTVPSVTRNQLPWGPFALACNSVLTVAYVHMSPSQMVFEEGLDPGPAVCRGFRPKRGTVGIEERVAGAVVAMKLMGLALLGEDPLQLVHVLGRGVLVVVAEQTEQRGAQPGQLVDQVGDLKREALRGLSGDECPVAVHGRVQVQATGRQNG